MVLGWVEEDGSELTSDPDDLLELVIDSIFENDDDYQIREEIVDTDAFEQWINKKYKAYDVFRTFYFHEQHDEVWDYLVDKFPTPVEGQDYVAVIPDVMKITVKWKGPRNNAAPAKRTSNAKKPSARIPQGKKASSGKATQTTRRHVSRPPEDKWAPKMFYAKKKGRK